jgi:NADPH-dependent 2,4-dienoyl-CoA reductase/sulfur reductase-like enzyme
LFIGVTVRHRVVIVGSSVGGVRTARALRAEGFTGLITLVGEEPELPYDRPPLSKQVLTGAWPAERAGLLTAQAAADAGVELRLGVAARSLDTDARRVHLADGEVLPYDDLVIATGASARPSPWQPESGVYTLRTLADCLTLKKCFADGAAVAMIGGGFIGAEAAAAAWSAGCDVTLIDAVALPMERAAGPVVAALLADVQRDHGARTRFGVGVRSVTGRAGDLVVTLSDASVVRAEAVVVGIGALPNDQWLQGSGLTIEDGVVCDAYLAAVGATHVFAIGDVARWPHPGLDAQVRSEHWTNAADQARCVARTIARPEAREPYQPSDYIWSDQYDWKLQLAGQRSRAVAEWVIGPADAQRPRVTVLHEDAAGQLCGAVCLNWPKAFVQCRRLLDERAPVARARELLGGP